jgi:amiloride-sensitive sodium channel
MNEHELIMNAEFFISSEVGPGKETQVGVTAIDTYSADAVLKFKPENRECFFGTEQPLNYHKEYSRSACVIECESDIILKECNCVPYYSPGKVGSINICRDHSFN